MTRAREIALELWCVLSSLIAELDDLAIWQAFRCRDEVRCALLAGETLTDDEQAALHLADQAFDRAAAEVMPFLRHRGWLDALPGDHYARTYAARHQGE